MLGGLEQADHARLHQVVDFHLRRQPTRQVVGDALDEVGVLAHERVEVGLRSHAGIGLYAVHLITCSRATGRVSSLSKKNSSRPLACGGDQRCTSCARRR
jgi:hypothetical protein